jgi:hypothetical protein
MRVSTVFCGEILGHDEGYVKSVFLLENIDDFLRSERVKTV